jgi:hypothetical protein
LILTSSSGFHFTVSDFAEITVPFPFRFVWERLPPSNELAAYLGPGSGQHGRGSQWTDYVDWTRRGGRLPSKLALIEFCRHYDVVEFWFDPSPNDQLQLIWLLDHFCSDLEIRPKLKIRIVDFDLVTMPEQFGADEVSIVDVTEDDLESARLAWQAYREPTPESCFDLLHKDLSALPLLKPALRDLLDELPSASTGLGVTEMRMLEMIGWGYQSTNALFHLREFRRTHVFNEPEHGYLLDGLAHGPTPAVSGLDDELCTLARENHRDRLHAHHRSRLRLTDFGKAVLAHKEDFSRHNPIDRWWGGTHLTNEQLWRYGAVLRRP